MQYLKRIRVSTEVLIQMELNCHSVGIVHQYPNEGLMQNFHKSFFILHVTIVVNTGRGLIKLHILRVTVHIVNPRKHTYSEWLRPASGRMWACLYHWRAWTLSPPSAAILSVWSHLGARKPTLETARNWLCQSAGAK